MTGGWRTGLANKPCGLELYLRQVPLSGEKARRRDFFVVGSGFVSISPSLLSERGRPDKNPSRHKNREGKKKQAAGKHEIGLWEVGEW